MAIQQALQDKAAAHGAVIVQDAGKYEVRKGTKVVSFHVRADAALAKAIERLEEERLRNLDKRPEDREPDLTLPAFLKREVTPDTTAKIKKDIEDNRGRATGAGIKVAIAPVVPATDNSKAAGAAAAEAAKVANKALRAVPRPVPVVSKQVAERVDTLTRAVVAHAARSAPASVATTTPSVPAPDRVVKGSVVKKKYREQYKAKGTFSCGDIVADELREYVTKLVNMRPMTDLVKLREVADANGVWDDRYGRLNPGMQRMNIGNRLRSLIAQGRTNVHIGGTPIIDPDLIEKAVAPKAAKGRRG